MNFANNSTFANFITIAGLVGIGYGLAMHTKMAKVSNRLDQSIESLADGAEIDIPETMVNKAVERAVANATRDAARSAINSAMVEIKSEIHNKVSEAVKKEYNSIKDKVLAEATIAASKIDAAKVRKDVEEAAKEAALEKFDDNLDDILEDFRGNLQNSTKILQSVQSALNPANAISTVTTAPGVYAFRVGC